MASVLRVECEIWKETAADRSTQLVFCDLSTPSQLRPHFSACDDLKAKLVQRGTSSEQIAFIQDYDSDAEKHALFGQAHARESAS